MSDRNVSFILFVISLIAVFAAFVAYAGFYTVTEFLIHDSVRKTMLWSGIFDRQILIQVEKSVSHAPAANATTSTTPYISFSASPTYIVRGNTYTFSGRASGARRDSRVYFYLQGPDGTMKYNGQPGEAFLPEYSGYLMTDANGNLSLSLSQIIPSQGQNGVWTSWVAVGGQISNKVYYTVVSSASTQQ